MTKSMRKISALLLGTLLCLWILSLSGCADTSSTDLETENLVKLCKVWGYTKYYHPAFLLGRLDWDDELLKLIPQVREAKTDSEVNTLLHDWFAGLGDIDYGSTRQMMNWLQAPDESKVIIADTSWTGDAEYLGEALAEDLSQWGVLPTFDRSSGPAWTGGIGSFINEPEHEAVYDDAGFRLLGLFRLWNAMEYYYPYLDLLDRDWEDLLREHIPQMLEGTDQVSYDRTLASIGYQLHDPHVMIGSLSDSDALVLDWASYIKDNDYNFPVSLTEAEGKLVVNGTAEGCPLALGDVLLSINGKDIETLTEERILYECYPREDAILNRMWYSITASGTAENEVTVLRDNQELTFSIQFGEGVSRLAWDPQAFSQILEGNIGLINPGFPTQEQASEIMAELWDTDGLIIDLRQYPAGGTVYELSTYLLDEYGPAFFVALPAEAVPGAYLKTIQSYGPSADDSPYYDKPVVLLMCNYSTQSAAETAVTILGSGRNVITMGENSAGGNGGMAILPLPGGLVMTFSSQGFYTLEGERTQQTGITPDIPVPRTVQGIKEGRDEVLEAAIRYISDLLIDR